MSCNCGKKRKKPPAGYIYCVKCGKKKEINDKIVKQYWIECAKCITEKKMLCGICAQKQGLKELGGNILTEKWHKIRNGCLKAAEKKAAKFSEESKQDEAIEEDKEDVPEEVEKMKGLGNSKNDKKE
jgi:hypothetical protein